MTTLESVLAKIKELDFVATGERKQARSNVYIVVHLRNGQVLRWRPAGQNGNAGMPRE